MVTASTPIVVSINHQDSVAAVVGLRMQYLRFYQLFMESTQLCDDDNGVACNYTCRSDVSHSVLCVSPKKFKTCTLCPPTPDSMLKRFVGKYCACIIWKLTVFTAVKELRSVCYLSLCRWTKSVNLTKLLSWVGGPFFGHGVYIIINFKLSHVWCDFLELEQLDDAVTQRL